MSDRRSLMIRSPEHDPIVFGCGNAEEIARLVVRFTEQLREHGAAVAIEAGCIPCCMANPDLGLWCHMADSDDDIERQRLLLALALARSENEENVATWLATRVIDSETQFPPGVARMLLDYIAR